MTARSITLGLVFLVAAAHVSARPATADRDACQLLTKRDVAAVQGQAFSDTRLTSRGNRSQCFYQLPAFVDSISLDVIRDGGELWEKYFEEEHAEEEEEEGEKTRPRPVPGIGEEAYWVGAGSTGSLYVLAKDVVLRVSVGGSAPEAEKIKRSKLLAAKALRRL